MKPKYTANQSEPGPRYVAALRTRELLATTSYSAAPPVPRPQAYRVSRHPAPVSSHPIIHIFFPPPFPPTHLPALFFFPDFLLFSCALHSSQLLPFATTRMKKEPPRSY
ncbi:hypothetical protein ACOMHN_014144 [Nucella lapillus]